MKKRRLKIASFFLAVYLVWGFLCLVIGSDQDTDFQRIAGVVNCSRAKYLRDSVEVYYNNFGKFPPTLRAAVEFIYPADEMDFSNSLAPISTKNRWHFIWQPKSIKDFIISLFIPCRFDTRLIPPGNVLSFEYRLSELDLKTAPPDLVVFETPKECGKAAGYTVTIGDFFSGGRMKINKKQPQKRKTE